MRLIEDFEDVHLKDRINFIFNDPLFNNFMATPGIPGLDNLSQKDRESVMKELNSMQMMESIQTYNGLVDRCFNECVSSFRSKTVDSQETDCVKKCVAKSMEYSQRVGRRFGEKNSGVSSQ
jgi:import inner membrane translocase subunit TIM9